MVSVIARHRSVQRVVSVAIAVVFTLSLLPMVSLAQTKASSESSVTVHGKAAPKAPRTDPVVVTPEEDPPAPEAEEPKAEEPAAPSEEPKKEESPANTPSEQAASAPEASTVAPDADPTAPAVVTKKAVLAVAGTTGNDSNIPLCAGGLRIDPVPMGETSYTHTFTFDGGSATVHVTINVYNTANGPAFDFTSDWPVATVIAKGGSEGYTPYEYGSSGVTSGTGLHAPVTGGSGTWAGLSHIDFCFAKPGCLWVWKFEDHDGDKKKDGDDAYLSGWTIQVKRGDEIVAERNTNADGVAKFQLPPGEYTVTEVFQDGWHNTTVLPLKVEVCPCEKVEVCIGNQKDCKPDLKIRKFRDYNSNGVLDQGEPLLGAGWSFTLRQGDQVIGTQVTGSNSIATFADLEPGVEYSITEYLPTDWFNTTPLPMKVTLTAGEDTCVDIGNRRFGKLKVVKYHDIDHDNSKDEGEPFLSGFVFTLSQGGQVVARAETDANGEALFPAVPPGMYVLDEESKSPWYPTSELPRMVELKECTWQTICIGNTYDVEKKFELTFHKLAEGAKLYAEYRVDDGEWVKRELTGGPLVYASGEPPIMVPVGSEIDFKWWIVIGDEWLLLDEGSETLEGDLTNKLDYDPIIEGSKYEDLNASGAWDKDTESGIVGWTITLERKIGDAWVFADSVVTGPGGAYKFEGMVPGTYRVTETLLGGWFQSDAPDGTFEVAHMTHVTGADFGNYRKQDICGTKFEDANHNHQRDEGEIGLGGWEIHLLNAAGQVIASTTTASDGSYCFTSLDPGEYGVVEVLQPGWTQTFPVDAQGAPRGYELVLTSASEQTGIDFGNYGRAKVYGHKYKDVNGNGVFDQGTDEPLANWTIELREPLQVNASAELAQSQLALGPLVDTDVTDQDGYYEFYVRPGIDYTLNEILTAGWTQQAPAGGGAFFLTNIAPQSENGPYDFLNWQPALVTGHKYEDLDADGKLDPEDTLVASFSTIQLKNAKGDVIATTTTDENGAYTFGNLVPGQTYTVVESPVDAAWHQSFPADNGGHPFTATSGGQHGPYDFLNWRNAKIYGYKFEDVDGDGKWDDDEPGINGWGIQLKDGKGELVASTQTVASEGKAGYFEFLVKPGVTYAVVEEDREGWKRTTPADPGTFPVTPVSGQTGEALIFGNQEESLPFTDLEFTKVGDKTVADPGDLITYTLTYRNTGDAVYEGPFTIVDDYDETLVTVVDANGGTVADGKITWTDTAALAVGESRSITYVVKVDSDLPEGTTIINNVATITPTGQQGRWKVTVEVPGEDYLPYTGLNLGILAMLSGLILLVGITLRRVARSV